MMQGCCTPLPPRPHGIPLPVKSVLFLFGLVAFPLFWVVLFGLVLSPPCGVGHRYVLVAILENLCWPFPPANGAPVPALMRLSLCEEALVLPPSGLRGFVPVVRERWEGPAPFGGLQTERVCLYAESTCIMQTTRERYISLSLSLPLSLYVYVYTFTRNISVAFSLCGIFLSTVIAGW